MDAKKKTRYVEVVLGLLIGLLVLATLMLAAVPPVSRDALTHHLAVPKLYLQSGGMHEIPEVVFSYYPMNLDLLYLIPLYFGNDIIPKYIHLAFGLLTAWLIRRFLQGRTGQRAWGLLGALLFLSVPIIIKLSITVYVDLGLVFFSTAALLYAMKWALDSRQVRHLCLAGVFCGLCLGTKYNGLIAFFLITCSIPVLYIRGGQRIDRKGSGSANRMHEPHGLASRAPLRAIGAAALFVAIALAVFSPWMIRNYGWTGNPLYPLYQSVFAGRHSSPAESTNALRPIGGAGERTAEKLSHFVIRKRVFNETLLEAVGTPVRIFFQGRDDNPRYFDGRLNPYLFFFPFLAFVGFRRLSRRQRLENAALAAFAVLFLLYTLFTVDMRIRYVAPIIPPLVILAVIGLHRGWMLASEKWSGLKRFFGCGLMAAATVFFLSLNGIYVYTQFRVVDPLGFLTGKLDRDAYITQYRDEYPAFQYINHHLAKDATILAVYLGNRIYYSDRRMFCGDDFFNEAVRVSDSAGQLHVLLRSRGFSHMLIHNDFFEKFLLAYLDAEGRKLVKAFFEQHAKLLFDHGNYRVFGLIEHPTIISD